MTGLHRPRAVLLLGSLLAQSMLAGCGRDEAATLDRSTIVVADAPDVAALAPRPDGGFIYGERRTGRVMAVDASGAAVAEPVAVVTVSANGQRGLLGLTVDASDRVFASWSRPDGRLVAAQVSPAPVRPVWDGPATATLANGGHLAFGPNGRLLIGIGDLQAPPLVADPSTPNGKLLALDPDGPPDQIPAVVSGGWNNPFAFTVTDDGAVWIADNAPGSVPERLARGDIDRTGAGVDPPVALPKGTAPSGLTSQGNVLFACSYLRPGILRYRIPSGGRSPVADGRIEVDCRLGVIALADGRLLFSTGRALRAR